MTRVSTSASVPPILHISTARALQTAARSGLSRKTRRRLFPSFDDSPPAAGKLERRRGRSPTISRLSKPGGPLNKASSEALRRSASTGMLSAFFSSSRTRARPRRYKTRERTCGFLLLVAAAHETTGAVRLASPLDEYVKGALRKSLILVVLYRQEVGPFRALQFRLQPTWCANCPPSLLGTEGFAKDVSLDSDSVRCRERSVLATARFTTEPCVRWPERLFIV